MPSNNASIPTSTAAIVAKAETAKFTAIKAAAAAIVITMATDVSNGNFSAARAKAAQLEVLYGQAAASKAA